LCVFKHRAFGEAQFEHNSQIAGFVRPCRIRSSRWPCGVPQRQAAGSAQAPASPVPVASARLPATEIHTLVSSARLARAHTRLVTNTNSRRLVARARCPRRGLTLPSSGHPTAGHTGSLRQGR
jgi:hypothetical protein